MWFVALSHRPHFPSLPILLSVSLSRREEVSSFSDRPTGKLNRIASLRWLTRQHRELHTIHSPAMTAHHTTPRPGSHVLLRLPLLVRVFLPVLFCFSVCLVAIFCVSLHSCCLVKMLHCLPVFTLPSVCLYFYQPVLYIVIFWNCFWYGFMLVSLTYLSDYLPACRSVSISQYVPWYSNAMSKHRRTPSVDFPSAY